MDREVEHCGGNLLFAARVSDPLDAEDLVRKLFNIPSDHAVSAWRPADLKTLDDFKVDIGGAKYPF